jgi:hypothetical protein
MALEIFDFFKMLYYPPALRGERIPKTVFCPNCFLFDASELISYTKAADTLHINYQNSRGSTENKSAIFKTSIYLVTDFGTEYNLIVLEATTLLMIT